MVFTLVFGTLVTVGGYFRSPFVGLLVVGAVVQGVALYWRRSHPTAVLLATILTILIAVPLTPEHDFAGPGLIFAAYAASAYGPNRVRIALVVAAIVLVLAGVGLLLVDQFAASRSVLPAGVTTLVVWVAGDYMRSRRAFVADLIERNRQEREQAAEDERLRIARELHDVVAHNVSVIAIQAGATRVSGNSSHEALASIESTARDTLSELNRLVGVLRRGPAAAELAPQPGLGQVESLVKPLRDAGIDVTLKITGGRHDLPAALDLSAYRIVQEALTNVLKHASATRVEVTVDYGADAVTLTIGDNGSGAGAAAGDSTGHGIIGMRERAGLFGGEVIAGSSPLGGFTVRASLPLR